VIEAPIALVSSRRKNRRQNSHLERVEGATKPAASAQNGWECAC